MFEIINQSGSLAVGLAVTTLAIGLLNAPSRTVSNETRRLMDGCEFYRFFGAWIEDLRQFLKPRIKKQTSAWAAILRVNNAQLNLRRGEKCRDWDVESWIARELVRSLLRGLGVGALLLMYMPIMWALSFGLLLVCLFYFAEHASLAKRSKSWRARFHQRLPFSIDLIALTMKAGATIEQSLNAVLEENTGHPIGDEFEQIIQQHQNGTPLLECFENFRSRMSDKDVNEIVFTAINAERYGGANADTYLRLADQMRVRRSQRAEKEIGEAKTMMALPNFLFLMSGMLAIAGPVVLQMFNQAGPLF